MQLRKLIIFNPSKNNNRNKSKRDMDYSNY